MILRPQSFFLKPIISKAVKLHLGIQLLSRLSLCFVRHGLWRGGREVPGPRLLSNLKVLKVGHTGVWSSYCRADRIPWIETGQSFKLPDPFIVSFAWRKVKCGVGYSA